MIDQFNVSKYLITVEKLAKSYANDYHDFNELFSEGQLALVEYLNKEDGSRPNLTGRLYSVIKHRITSLANTIDDNIDYNVDINSIIQDTSHIDSELLNDALNSIKDREKDIICKFYGLYTTRCTLSEIANEYHISKSCVKDIRKRGEKGIKQYLSSCGIFNYIDCEL